MKNSRENRCWWMLSLLWALLVQDPVRGASPIPLRAGPVTMLFEPDNAFLRYINVGPHELLRGIFAPIRDQSWGTVRPVVTHVVVDDQGDHFSVSFDVSCREQELDFSWHGTLKGSANGEIEFGFDGTAQSTFLRNRIGFCVLHGPSAAGKPWVIENIRGEKLKGRFPDYISPHQPAKEIREIAHELADGLWAHVRCEGETFEMEDQRNWTDASFKTYCTPLEIPYPVQVLKGSKVQQKITVRLAGKVAKPSLVADRTDHRPSLTLKSDRTALPRIGLQVSSETSELSAIEQGRLKSLNLDHLRVDLSLTNQQFSRQLLQATAQAKALGVKLHIGLKLGPDPEASLNRLLPEVESARPPVSIWLVVGTNSEVHALARRRLGALGTQALVGTTQEDINFTALNRARPAPEMMEAVAYGATPQIHAFDNLSIMETLPILSETVRSARQFVGTHPLMVAPILFRIHPTGKQAPPGELPTNVDPRQPTMFAAAWTLGSLKYLAEAGVQSLTYYETVGWKGVMESASGPPMPDKFPSQPGELFPIYHVLREVGEFAGGEVQKVESSDTLAVAGLALKKDKRLRLLVANLTERPLTTVIRGLGESVELHALGGPDARLGGPVSDVARRSTESTSAMELPIQLPPYGIVRLDRPVGPRHE